MKKTLKAILAAALAVIMMIPCISGFAANETLAWFFYDYLYTYDYAGEITVGTTAIPADASDYIWYSFDVPEAGFYYIHYDYSDLDAWFGVPESFEGLSATNEANCIYHSPDDGDGKIYYFEAGKTIVGFDLYYYEENSSFETEFLGAEITEVKPQYDLIYDYDIYEDEYMGEIICDVEADFDITFSGGETISEYYLPCTTESAVVAGENTFKTEILDKEYEFTANVYYVTDYVESVEISNLEDYLYVYEYYNGTDYEYPIYETIKATFKDGSTYTVSIYEEDYIRLPNGREVGFGFDFDSNPNGEYQLYVYVAGDCFGTYDCEVVEASAGQNLDTMTQVAQYHISDAAYFLGRAFEVLLEDGVFGIFSNSAEALLRIEWSISSFVAVFDEITSYLLYILA